MNYVINSIVRKTTKGNKPFNILTTATHESFETNWCKAHMQAFALNADGYKDWNHQFRKLPKNYYILPRAQTNFKEDLNKQVIAFIQTIPKDISFDCVVIQNNYATHNILSAIAQHLSIPTIEIQHCLPPENSPKYFLDEMKAKTTNKKVFITDYSRERWGYNKDEAIVIRHMTDANLFYPDRTNQNNHILTVANEYKDRDYFLGYTLYEEVTKNLPRKNIGNCPGLSEAAKNVEELVQGYQKSTVFLNTSLISPVPMSLLEAATAGCAIVTTATAEIPFFFTHGENALMSNNPKELRKFCIDLMNNEQERIRLGDNARKMTLEKMF